MAQAFRETSVERVRAYWNARPCNIRHSLQPVGTKEYFDEVEARKYFVEPHIPAFADFPRWAGKRVLEIGCGIGTDTINFARAGAQVTAVDLSEASLAMARKRAEVFGLTDKVRFYAADAERLSETVPPEPYDLIYSFGVIHHTPHPERVVQQVREHFVGPESTMKIMVYNRYSWKVFWIVMTAGKGAFWKMDDLVARYSEAETGCPVTYTYTPWTARQLLQGFRVTNRFADHIFPYRIPDYVQYRYVMNWYFRILPRPLFRQLERWFGWHLCLTARLA
jgi:2-polyprenyl-3-methyl-5-hydroxy-6-metoxy-1,4-benzoquinol methylase